MEMENGLSRFFSRIHHEAEAVFLQLFFFRNVFDDKKEISEFSIGFFIEIQNVFDVKFRNDEDVNRRSGLDVSECQPIFVLIDFIARYISRRDFTKNTIFHHKFLLHTPNHHLAKSAAVTMRTAAKATASRPP